MSGESSAERESNTELPPSVSALLDTTFNSGTIACTSIDNTSEFVAVSQSAGTPSDIGCINDEQDLDHLSSVSGPSSGAADDDSPFLESESERLSDENSVQIESDLESDVLDMDDDSPILCGIRVHDMLCENSDVKIFEAYLLAFQYAIRHSLTKTAFTELLQLISVHLPSDAKYPKSVHEVKKLFLELFPHATPDVHNYCEYCLSILNVDEVCSTPGCRGAKTEQFISVPLAPQLKKLMEDQVTWNALQERFQIPHSSSIIRDVYDGVLYKKHSAFLSQPANVSLVVNTDGVAVFRSSTVSLWPIWLIINELPKRMRFRKQYILLGGMWFSKAKPPMNSFLKPLMTEMNDLHKTGILVNAPNGQCTAKAILVQCSADLPARAQLTNMKNFNGKWGCLYCDSEGQTTSSDHLHRFWPYDPAAVRRSPQSFIDAGKEALTDGDCVQGVKGPTVLSIHAPLQLPPAMVIDDLHCIYLGVTKLLMKLWFAKEMRHKCFSIRNKLKICDEKLLHIKVPDVISRVPKSLSDIAHWKGSEFRNWLLFYSLPVLKDILPNPYFSHYSLLVVGLWLLSSDSITMESLGVARCCLAKFYMQFHQLYGEKNTTMNVHLLSHLADCVKYWGPLWCYTCFVFETMNMHLKKFFHGTKNMTKQMAFSYVAMQSLITLPPLCTDHDSTSKTSSLLATLFGVKQSSNRQKLNPGTYLVGGSTPLTLPDYIVRIANEHINFCELPAICLPSMKVQTFYRVEINGNTYYSALYGRVRRRNSYTIAYHGRGGERKYGLVQYYFVLPGQSARSPLVVVKVLQTLPVTRQSHFGLTDPAIEHLDGILPVKESLSWDVTDLTRIISKCLYITFSREDGDKYVFQFPNEYIHD